MANKNYNKYFKTNEEKSETKEVKEITNDKNVRGTSLEVLQKDEPKVQAEVDELSSKTTKGGVISPCKVNLRESTTKNSPVICVLEPGTNVVVDNIEGDWAHIYIPQGVDGYVMKEYIIISQL